MPSEVYFAKSCLIEFVKGVEELYGLQHCSFNVHLLTHLAQAVLNWGPLFAQNAFVFEDCNQELLLYIQSSQSVPLQICDTFRLRYGVKRLQSKFANSMTDSQLQYLDSVFHKKSRPQPTLYVDGVYLLGQEIIIGEMPCAHYLAFQRIDVDVDSETNVRYYHRILINGEIVHSKQYSKPKKRRSYYVLLNNGEIFQIETFVILTNIFASNECYAIGQHFIKIKDQSLVPNTRLEHMVQLKALASGLTAVRAAHIREKVTLIELENMRMILGCIHPNHSELLT